MIVSTPLPLGFPSPRPGNWRDCRTLNLIFLIGLPLSLWFYGAWKLAYGMPWFEQCPNFKVNPVSKVVGLALGGGGARGWAHIGVFRALEEQQSPIHYLAGTSIGALVGAIYVRDQLHRLEQFADDICAD